MFTVDFCILQIMDSKVEYLFQNYETAMNCGGPDPKHYMEMYESTITMDKWDEMSALDTLFFEFNLNHPSDYYGRSLSVSDIVLFVGSGNAYYCDDLGWKLIPNFGREWLMAPLAVKMQRLEESATHNARFAAAKICRGTCSAPYGCKIPHEKAANTLCHDKCPLEHYLTDENASIREKMMSHKTLLTKRDRSTICLACQNTKFCVEQGNILVCPIDKKKCKHCPVNN